jgi:hypothetical protein
VVSEVEAPTLTGSFMGGAAAPCRGGSVAVGMAAPPEYGLDMAARPSSSSAPSRYDSSTVAVAVAAAAAAASGEPGEGDVPGVLVVPNLRCSPAAPPSTGGADDDDDDDDRQVSRLVLPLSLLIMFRHHSLLATHLLRLEYHTPSTEE